MKDKIRQYHEHGSEGFTLIELLIVIVIIGILAAIVVFSVSGVQNTAGKNACNQNVNEANTATEAFYATNHYWPGGSTATPDPTTVTSAQAGAALVPTFLKTDPSTAGAQPAGEPLMTYTQASHTWVAACV